MTSIDKLLQKARKLREQGKPWVALDVFNKVLTLGQKTKRYEKIVEGLGDRAIAWRHLFDETADPLFAVLARKDAETMLELVKMWGISEKLHTAYYLLGQAALLFQEYKEAENFFFKSLRYFKGNPSEKASWKYHWAKALFMMGQKKKALLAFASAITDIKKYAGMTDAFLTNVYLSGAYMNFAFVLAHDGRKREAKKYFLEAKEITAQDKRLVIRRKQLTHLASALSSLGLKIRSAV